MELLEWAEEQPLFTLNEAERALELGREYLRLKVHRAVEKGDLERVERGKYTVHEPMVYATYIRMPSYISLWTALNYYGLTAQEPSRVQVMVGESRKDTEKVGFLATEHMYGFGKERYRGFDIFMVAKEKLLIDCLSTGEVPVSEMRELVEEVERDRTVEYARRTGKKSVMKRTGYLLERIKGVEAGELKTDDRNYTPLDLSQPGGGDKDPEWRVEVNTDAV